MKTLAIISGLILMGLSAPSFAGNKPNDSSSTQQACECGTNENTCEAMMDQIHAETELMRDVPVDQLSAMLFRKLSEMCAANNETMLDHIQHETESIAILKPILFVAGKIEDRLHAQKNSDEHHSVSVENETSVTR